MACKNLTSSIKGKISNFKNVNLLAELLKRVPLNQLEQFFDFRNMSHDYQARVDKFPAKLPKIDWEYYRANVRKEYIKMVDDFEKKYEELNKIFDNRGQVDTTKYFKEVDKVKSEVKVDIEKYIKESNERIKMYEQEIERLRNMIPYEQMTCEDYCVLFPENAHILGAGDNQGFWPHMPEEQLGYVAPETKRDDSNLEADAAAMNKALETQQAPQPSPTPSKKTPGGTAATTPTPKTTEIPQPSPANEKPDPKKATPAKPETAEVPQPSPAKEKPVNQKPSTTSKEDEKKPSTQKKESDKNDDPKNNGEKK